MLVKLSQPEGLVVSVEEAKHRARVSAEEDFDDGDIEKMIRTATAMVEGKIARTLLPTEFEFRACGWETFRIPLVPFRDVLAVGYVDEAHEEQVVTDGEWYFENDDRGGTLYFTDAFAHPALSDRPWPVRIRVAAGHDDPTDPGDNPVLSPDPRDAQMVLMLVAHWYNHREVASAPEMTSIPVGLEALAAQRRIYR